MGLRIRRTRKEDIKPLAEIYASVYKKFDVGEKWTKQTAQKLLAYWFSRNKKLCFTAIVKNRIVGAFFADIKPWWDGNHLVDGEVFVSADFQKMGIGTELSIKLYEIALKEFDVVCFDTYTFKLNGHPYSWYKAQGFKDINEWVMISGDVKKALKRLKAKRKS